MIIKFQVYERAGYENTNKKPVVWLNIYDRVWHQLFSKNVSGLWKLLKYTGHEGD